MFLSHVFTEVSATDVGTIGDVIILAVARDGILTLRFIEGEEKNPLVLAADALIVLSHIELMAFLGGNEKMKGGWWY